MRGGGLISEAHVCLEVYVCLELKRPSGDVSPVRFCRHQIPVVLHCGHTPKLSCVREPFSVGKWRQHC